MRPQVIAFLIALLAAAPGPAAANGGEQLALAAAETQASPPQAQSGERTKVQGGFGLLVGVPVGDFAENVDSAGGFSGHLDVGLGDSVFSLGGEMAYLFYGTESRRTPLSPTIPEIVVTVNTDNTMFLLHGRVRAQTREGRFRPYVDGLLGFAYIATTSSIEESTDCDLFGCSNLGSTNLDDFALNLGGGAGLQIGFGAPPHSIRLDLSVRYLAGGEANYLREGAIRRVDDRAFLDVSHSRTDMVGIYIGLVFGR
jgi:hypothetical protein